MTTETSSSAKNFPVDPLARLPYLEIAVSNGVIPTEGECCALWDRYGMLDNIRAHSRRVAEWATALAQLACDRGIEVNVAEVRASALLHDIAKTCTIRYGGSHAQLGASWIVSETQNRALAQGIMLHVHWPWEVPQDAGICRLPFFVMYADKRVKHDRSVTLDERFQDLLVRYGSTEAVCQGIAASHRQGLLIERALSAQLGCPLHEYTLDRGRLVKRA